MRRGWPIQGRHSNTQGKRRESGRGKAEERECLAELEALDGEAAASLVWETGGLEEVDGSVPVLRLELRLEILH